MRGREVVDELVRSDVDDDTVREEGDKDRALELEGARGTTVWVPAVLCQEFLMSFNEGVSSLEELEYVQRSLDCVRAMQC